MNDRSMREQLLGYLLGALEPAEHQAIEARLLADPELREQFELLQARLLPLAEAEEGSEPVPPRGLAGRTCRYVIDRLGPSVSQFGGSCTWRVQDLAVAAGFVCVAAMLFFPAVLSSRNGAQIRGCQANLMNLGHGLVEYSTLHDGYFPRVPAAGRLSAAGVYAPALHDAGLISSSDVICPGSELARCGEFHIPTVAALRASRGAELRQMKARMGGSYGYGMGYLEDGHYHALRNRGRATYALMADSPEAHSSSGCGGSACGSRGHNVLFEDGHVSMLTTCRLAELGDHIFRNALG
ncbi:MAG TPA: hypothetical protein VIK18_12500, partial [Pirellulales bacterium]